MLTISLSNRYTNQRLINAFFFISIVGLLFWVYALSLENLVLLRDLDIATKKVNQLHKELVYVAQHLSEVTKLTHQINDSYQHPSFASFLNSLYIKDNQFYNHCVDLALIFTATVVVHSIVVYAINGNAALKLVLDYYGFTDGSRGRGRSGGAGSGNNSGHSSSRPSNQGNDGSSVGGDSIVTSNQEPLPLPFTTISKPLGIPTEVFYNHLGIRRLPSSQKPKGPKAGLLPGEEPRVDTLNDVDVHIPHPPIEFTFTENVFGCIINVLDYFNLLYLIF